MAVYGNSAANHAVWGISGSSTGVRGESTSGNGVYGYTTYNGVNLAAGVFGKSTSTGVGVYGEAVALGVWGKSDDGNSHIGVRGEGYVGVYGDGKMYGIYGIADQFGQAGHFEGNVNINGTISKTTGTFKIDHPLDPANKYLYHSFVESPDMMNIYNGIVTLDEQGEAVIEMAEWFEALNFDFRYQLTCLGEFAPVFIAQKITDRKFKIAGGKPGQEISWMVTGIRQDAYAKAHRIQVEEDKTGEARGKYLTPEVFGQPPEMAIYSRSRQA